MSAMKGMNDIVNTVLNPMTLLAGKGKSDPPAVMAPAVMPTPNDAAVQDAKRRKILEIQARTGRAGTVFTGQEDRVGG